MFFCFLLILRQCVCAFLPFFCYFTVFSTLFFTSLILLCLETLSNAHTKCTIMRVFPPQRKKTVRRSTHRHKKLQKKKKKLYFFPNGFNNASVYMSLTSFVEQNTQKKRRKSKHKRILTIFLTFYSRIIQQYAYLLVLF